VQEHDIEAIRARIGDRLIVVSVSGGKDSGAACLHLKELDLPYIAVFANTNWERESTLEYIRGELTRVIGAIKEVRGKYTLPELVKHKGMFPSRTRRFCTTELKVKPLAAFVRALDDDVVNVVGIRAAESEARSKLAEWEWSDTFDCEVWRPLINWTEQDVIDIHHRHGLKPNPLYLLGASRVGCWPCIHARKSEIKFIADNDPARIDEIRQLEADTQASATARYTERGETFETLGYMRPTFFQGPIDETCEACGGTGGKRCSSPLHNVDVDADAEPNHECDAEPCERCKGEGRRRGMWPIDKVVSWSRTSRGGRQLEMFADKHDGCARWGMCERAEET
jgi:3'-phosphoadenosine 5'-phosphosulfate sulfotransferase (PAPS reductase)/FAD synthetase